MSNLLFIGSFLSKIRGSKGVSESLAERLVAEGIACQVVSQKENQGLRLIDIIWTLLQFKGETIHVDVFSGPAFHIAEVATWIAARRSKKILLTLHGGKLTEFAFGSMPKVAKVLNRAHQILTPSLFLQDFFQKRGFQVSYLPNALDIEQFPFKKIAVADKLVWVRAFTSIYNPAIAVLTLAEVRKKYPLTTLTMIGPDRGLMTEIKSLIASLALEDAVEITGAVPNDQLYRYYHSHSIYINTTSYESFGVALAEAAACGTPVVSTAVGEIPHLWQHEENILLVDALDPKAFAEAIIRLIQDPELAERLSVNARRKAESFDWKYIKPQWLRLVAPE